MKQKIAVACHDAAGAPAMRVYEVEVDDSSAVDQELSRNQAMRAAMVDGMNPPFIAFLPDQMKSLVDTVKAMELVPQVIAVDVSGGVVQSVRCDAGAVNVVTYETEDIEGEDDVGEYPVGWNGELVLCHVSHMGSPALDPGLAAVRNFQGESDV